MMRVATIASGKCAFALAMLVFSATPSIAGFFESLVGRWAGSGTVFVRPLGDITVRCTLDVATKRRTATIAGTCRKGPFRRRLSIVLRSDDGRTFVGTYDGTREGVARLFGTVQGDTLALQIRWPKDVNGDRSASLVLERRTTDEMAQTVLDRVGGTSRATSHFVYRRR